MFKGLSRAFLKKFQMGFKKMVRNFQGICQGSNGKSEEISKNEIQKFFRKDAKILLRPLTDFWEMSRQDFWNCAKKC